MGHMRKSGTYSESVNAAAIFVSGVILCSLVWAGFMAWAIWQVAQA